MELESYSAKLRILGVVSALLVAAPAVAQPDLDLPELPVSTETAKLQPQDVSEYTAFGASVAVSGDLALVSGTRAGQGVTDVFKRANGEWTHETTLAPSDGNSLSSVALWGNTAVIGANAAAYVFARKNGAWIEAAKLVPDDAAADDRFGTSVAFDGNTAIVGAPGNSSSRGAAYVFRRNGAVWRQQAKLVTDRTSSAFGFSVAVSGGTVAVGAPGSNSVHVFSRSGGIWTEQAEFFGFRVLGLSVALAEDTAVAGDPGAQPSLLLPSLGLAYIFSRTGTLWMQEAIAAPDFGIGDQFGSSVAVAGAVAVIGSPGDGTGTGANLPDPDIRSGSAYVFGRNSDGEWTLHAKLKASDASDGDGLGRSAALDARTVVIGAPGDDEIGAAYVFSLVPVLLEQLRHSTTGIGLSENLVTKLQHADAYYLARDRLATCAVLSAFADEVSAQAGQEIGAADAAELTDRARLIISQIRCPDGQRAPGAGRMTRQRN